MTDDLVSRLRAAIEAKAAKARAVKPLSYVVAMGGRRLDELFSHERLHFAPEDGALRSSPDPAATKHFADNDPAATLAMCAAHLKIVELYAEHADYDNPEDSYEHATGRICGMGEALRLIARGYGLIVEAT